MKNTVEMSGWKLTYDAQSGQICQIAKENGDVVLRQNIPLFTARIGGISSNNYKSQMYHIIGGKEVGTDSRLIDIRFDETDNREPVVLLRTAFEGFEATTGVIFYKNDVQMKWTLKNCSESEQKVRWIRFQAGLIGKEDYDRYSVLAPGFMPELRQTYHASRKIADYRYEDLITTVRGEGLFPLDQSSLAGVYDDAQGYGVVSWLREGLFTAYTTLRKDISGVVVRSAEIFCPCVLGPEESVDVDGVFVGSFRRTRMDLIRHVCRTERAEAAAGPRILQISVGQRLSRTPFHRDDIQTITIITPTRFDSFDSVIEALDEIQSQGFDTLSIAPRFPFPGYTAWDLLSADRTYGDGIGVKRLIDAVHARGMRALLEIPMRGVQEFDGEFVGMQESPYMHGHDELFSYHERGMHARTYLRAFDFASPDFQTHIETVLRHYRQAFGADGFLMDGELWNDFPNWKPHGENRPYDSIPAGVGMMKKIREHLQTEDPNLLLLTEACGPSAACGHDAYLSVSMMRWCQWAFEKVECDRGTLAREHNLLTEGTLCWPEYAQWYEESRAAMPGNFLPIHCMDTYKSVEWTMFLGRQFTSELFGQSAHQVLSGILMFTPGGFLAYDGAQKGSEEVYRRLLTARRDEKACHGECSLTAVTASDARVATILWINEGEWLLFAANLDASDKCDIALCGEAVGEMIIDFKGYEIRLLKGRRG